MYRPRGFSMVELLVAISVMAIMAAVLVPAMATEAARARAAAAQASLEAIHEAILDFRADVGTGGQNEGYPSGMDQLVSDLTFGDEDICGASYSGGQRNRWDGPYLNRVVDADGVPVAVGTAAVDFLPLPGNLMAVVVVDVVDEDAVSLDRRVDDGDGATAGTVRWLDAGSGLVALGWVLPFSGC